jgi:hypothetical protein
LTLTDVAKSDSDDTDPPDPPAGGRPSLKRVK